MRFAIAIALFLLPSFAQAMDDLHPLRVDEARAVVGTDVLTADAVRLGRLVAVNEMSDGLFSCVVMLDRALRVQTSALMVAGLSRASDGSLRLADDAATLAARMNLPLDTSLVPVTR
ncbi:hypothetical protein [Jannaschia sp. M317]|uniref:hypothetical protein n=1 Tax=Jannaschia sp. M317 TaxID=2867011 RepID=UPI0021A6D715|nr:hypothetical protein [Jannaschia sp. M317]UWQ16337.1 hypothetical protein K3551_10395 [Jannaschia sp. M317]